MSVGQGHLPPTFGEWPTDQRIDFIATVHTRAGLVASVLAHAGQEPDRERLDSDYRLTKPELAAVYLQLEGFQ